MINNDFDQQYISLIKSVLKHGSKRITRSGAETVSIHGQMIKHALSEGFPLTTLRLIPFRLISSELEWVLRGKTDKNSLQKLNNHVWDKFCNPKYVLNFKNNKETHELMRKENDLGPIYGFQWRHFGAKYTGCDTDYKKMGFDQMRSLIKILKKNSFSKRLIVTSWNPKQINEMAVPSCPFAFQLIRHGDKLNLSFFQRSVDCIIGFPFDFAFYSLLLHLLSLQTKLKPGTVVGFFSNVEIFNRHIPGAKKLIKRKPKKLGEIKTEGFADIFSWKFRDSRLIDYQPNRALKFEVNISS